MHAAVEADKVQRKSRFTMKEGELKNSTVTEGETLVSNKNKVKVYVGY